MNILIAVHGFPPVQNAGAEKAAERIADWLVAQGHQVDVFTLGRLDAPDSRVETTIQNGITVHRLSCNLKSGSDPALNLYDNPLAGRAVEELLARRHFDLVHMVSGYLLAGQVIYAAQRAGLPVVITLTEYFYMCPRLNLIHADWSMCTGPDSDAKCARCLLEDKRRYRLPAQVAPRLMDQYWAASRDSTEMQRQTAAVARRRAALKAALEAADLVICPSHFIIEKYREYGFHTERFVFIRHGLNLPGGQKKPPAARPGTLKIGYIGQIKPHKGVDLLVRAVKGLVNRGWKVELHVWGRLNDHPVYSRRLVRRTRIYPQIHWRGGFQGAQVWDVLNSVDVLAAPSRWYENCPTVILEAFQAGLPVVTTHIGGMAELVQHGRNGLVFELNDAEDLRAQLERLISEPGLLARLRAGIPDVKTGDEEAAEIYAQYQRVLQEHNGAPVA